MNDGVKKNLNLLASRLVESVNDISIRMYLYTHRQEIKPHQPEPLECWKQRPVSARPKGSFLLTSSIIATDSSNAPENKPEGCYVCIHFIHVLALHSKM